MVSIPEIYPLIPHFEEGKFKIRAESLDAVPEHNRNKILRCDSSNSLDRLKWSVLMAHYEFNHRGINPELVEFTECENKVLNIRCKYIMRFTRTIEVMDGFFLIPGFTGFLINRDGVVRSIARDRILKTGMGPYGYPIVAVYDADKSTWRNISIHILMARTFVYNPAPWDKPFVNHIDGIKTNLDSINLEWVSSAENVDHAHEIGLSQDSMACKVMDHETGEVTNFRSRSEAGRYINLHGTPHSLYFQIRGTVYPKLFKGRYEIRDQSDETEWFYVTDERRSKPLYSIPPFEMKNLETGEVTTSDSLSELSRVSGVDRSHINAAIRSLLPKEVQGYQFREKVDEPWPTHLVKTLYRPPARNIKATSVKTGEVRTLGSTLSAAKALMIDKTTVKSRLLSGDLVGEWKLEEQ